MATLKELVQREQELSKQEERMSTQSQQLHQIKDLYELHAEDGKRFLSELRYQFHRTKSNNFWEKSEDVLIGEYQKVIGDLEDSEERLDIRKGKINQELDEITREKRILSMKEESE